MSIILTITVFYGVATILVFWSRHFGLNAAQRALIEDNHQKAVSLIWAWASTESIQQAHFRWGSKRFGSLILEPKPSTTRLFLPHILVIVVGVLIYQRWFRYGGPLEPGDCPNTPNCSNYLIGCLTRFVFLTALSKGYTRYQNCSGHKPVSFDERF